MSSSDEPPSSTGADVAENAPVTRNYELSAHRRLGMRTSTCEACCSIAHVTLTGPSFLTGYLLLNGATDLQLTVLLSLPYFLMIFQFAAAYLTSWIGRRKGLCSIGLVCYRGIHVLLALLPFVPGFTQSERLWMIFAMLLFSQAGFMLLANTWWQWMADLVPQKIRGRYFGFRSAVTLVLSTFWALAGGALLDFYKHQGNGIYGFTILFCVASAFALGGLFFLRRQYEPVMHPESVPTLKQIFGILRNDNFRRATFFMFIWNFGVGMMTFLAAKHMLGYMGMSFQQVMLYPVIINLIGFAFAKQWGKLMDSVGTRTTLLTCGLAAGLVPLLWLFTAPGTMWPIWVDAVATGLFMTGMNIAAVNLPLVVTPQKHRLYYLAVFATISGLGIGLASVLAGEVAMLLSHISVTLPGMGHSLVNYHIIFAVSALFRLGSMVLLINYQEENGRSLADAWLKIVGSVFAPFGKPRARTAHG